MKRFTGKELFGSFTSLSSSMKILELFYSDETLRNLANEVGLQDTDIQKLRKFTGLVLNMEIPDEKNSIEG